MTIVSYGYVVVLDAPSGSGAFSTSLVSLLVELRLQRLLPTLPLTLHIVGADLSPDSLELFKELHTPLMEVATRVGIHVKIDTERWDAFSEPSTHKLLDKLFSISEADDHLVIIANFSGALSKGTLFTGFMSSFRAITSRHYLKQGALLWIEPKSRSSKDQHKKLRHAALSIPFLGDWLRGADSTSLKEKDIYIFDPIQSKVIPVHMLIQVCETFPISSDVN